jgi:hypothetical protein
MKNFFLTAFAIIAINGISRANSIATQEIATNYVKIEEKVSITSIEKLNVIELYDQFKVSNQMVETGSVKCWLFGRWLRKQLSEVSNDTALINQTVEAAVALCNIIDDLGFI